MKIRAGLYFITSYKISNYWVNRHRIISYWIINIWFLYKGNLLFLNVGNFLFHFFHELIKTFIFDKCSICGIYFVGLKLNILFWSRFSWNWISFWRLREHFVTLRLFTRLSVKQANFLHFLRTCQALTDRSSGNINIPTLYSLNHEFMRYLISKIEILLRVTAIKISLRMSQVLLRFLNFTFHLAEIFYYVLWVLILSLLHDLFDTHQIVFCIQEIVGWLHCRVIGSTLGLTVGWR